MPFNRIFSKSFIKFHHFNFMKNGVRNRLNKRKNLVLDLEATIRYAKFKRPNNLRELNKIIENYINKNLFLIKDSKNEHIIDYEIVKQNSDELSVILVAIPYENIKPFLEYRPKSLKLKGIEKAKIIAKKEKNECLLYTGNYYFYIKNNVIEDIIDAKIFGPNWVIEEYEVKKVYF